MLTHIYDFVFASLCAYIKRPLTAIGGSGGAAGVFALAAIQHSTFLCDIQYCDLRKPTLQRSLLSLSLSHIPPLFAASLFLLPPPQFSLFLSFPPSLSLPLRPLFISELGKSCVTPTPPKPSFYFPSLSFENFLHNVTDRGPLTRHLSQYSQSEHTSCCYHEKVTTLSWSLNVSLRCIFFLY